MNKLFFLLSLLLSAVSLQVNAAACATSQDGDCDNAETYQITMKKLELCTAAPVANSYDVTCTGAVTVGTGSLEVNVASVSAGSAIATFATTTGLPIGTTFTHVKPTLSREIKIKGSVTLTDGTGITCRTDEDATVESGASKYERILAGKVSGTATLQTFYLNTDSGSASWATSSNDADLVYACLTQNCSSKYNFATYNKKLPSDSLYGLAIEDVTSSDDDFSMIYALSAPYTVGPTAPKIDIAFGTKGSLNCLNISGAQCNCSPYYVKSKITITD